MYSIVNVLDLSDRKEEGIRYIHGVWGSKDNFPFYDDAIRNGFNNAPGIPRFYVMLNNDQHIIGCFGLLTNDFVSRGDLLPWFGCLFVEEHERGQRLSQKMMEKGGFEAKRAGFSDLYLTTDHSELYEKFGWQRIEDGYDPGGKPTRIYKLSLI